MTICGRWRQEKKSASTSNFDIDVDFDIEKEFEELKAMFKGMTSRGKSSSKKSKSSTQSSSKSSRQRNSDGAKSHSRKDSSSSRSGKKAGDVSSDGKAHSDNSGASDRGSIFEDFGGGKISDIFDSIFDSASSELDDINDGMNGIEKEILRGEDIYFSVAVNEETLQKGGQVSLDIPVDSKCPLCKGTGAAGGRFQGTRL